MDLYFSSIMQAFPVELRPPMFLFFFSSFIDDNKDKLQELHPFFPLDFYQSKE